MVALRRFVLFCLLCLMAGLAGYGFWAIQSGAILALWQGATDQAPQPAPASAGQTRPASAPEAIPPLRIAVMFPGPTDPLRAREAAFSEMLIQLTRRFDLLAVHGFRGPGRGPFLPLLEAVGAADKEVNYLAYVPVRESTVRQFPVIFYRADRLVLDRKRSGPVDDTAKVFRWTPVVVSFAARQPPLANAFTFTAVVARVDPLRVHEELGLLAELLRTVAYQQAPEDDILLLAHLEADEDTVGRSLPDYVPAVTGIPNSAGGTRLASNILFHPVATCEFTGRSGVLTLDEILPPGSGTSPPNVHFLPVWAEFTATESPADRWTKSFSRLSAFLAWDN
ncbi:MAG: hypothetical protein NZ899_04545 [Thermoguttaceae bacterium]|nr:hypothetical protein [Thermoguttaceae bacterium]MDW8077855.1 hypothetical protein [Thermoguttaceae bacterium]